MPKLSRSQIREARKQAKEAREKALSEEETQDAEPKKPEEKKDQKGLTTAQRRSIREIKSNNDDNPTPKISWNYDNGDLVYLPDMSIGMIVQNEAKDLQANYFETDMKKTMKKNKYAGKVFVVTTSGNQWYYPNQLKKVNE